MTLLTIALILPSVSSANSSAEPNIPPNATFLTTSPTLAKMDFCSVAPLFNSLLLLTSLSVPVSLVVTSFFLSSSTSKSEITTSIILSTSTLVASNGSSMGESVTL